MPAKFLSLSQPRARFSHYAASVGGKVYLRGGRTKDSAVDDLSTIRTFDPLEEVWASARATGEPHPGVYVGACTAAGEELFYYGGFEGFCGDIRSSALSRFSPATLNWARLSSGSPDGPMTKQGCGMVSCGEGLLCVFAGYGIPTGPTQPGSQFIKNTRFTDGRGWTNELHLYDINGGVWSSPALTGTRPCPRSHLTLTAINGHQAIAFGGSNPEQGNLNDCFLIDFAKMEWSQLDIKGELPVPRDRHAACCLNFGDDHPQLLVAGGLDMYGKVLDDAWILDVHARTWRKVDLPSGSLPRADHSLTAVALGERVTAVVSFGGYCKWLESYRNDADVDPIDETTVMCFESCPSPPPAASPSQWTLTDVVTNHQREERLLDKMAQSALLEAVENEDSTVDPSLLGQLNKALAQGYIRSRVTTCLASGAPGSGKTHLRHFLYNQIPPEVRISTACLEQAQRAILSSQSDDPAALMCMPVDDAKMKEMTAENLKAGVQEREKPAITAPALIATPLTGNTASDRKQPKTPSEVDHSHAKEPSITPSISLPSSTEVSSTDRSAILPLPSSSSAAQTFLAEPAPRPPSTRLPGTADILELMKSTSGKECALEVHSIHFIDSGGQPQYLDMAPSFLHDISMVLPVLKLNERLSDTPNVEYCMSDLMYDLGNFDVSNEDMVVRAAQLTLFHKPQLPLPYVRSQPTEPVCAVVGTFLDKEGDCDETRAEKNDRLKMLLKPFGSKLVRRKNGDVIFPIDGTTAGQPVAQPVASELRRVISLAPCFEIDMPLQWQLLQLELGNLGVKVMLRSDITAIAVKLRFESQEAVEAALKYIDLAHLCIYVPEVLPNVVVIEPDAIHKKSTQLLEEHINLSDADDADIRNDELLQFRNQAIFTDKMLNNLPSEYDKAILPDLSLACLLQHKLLLVKIPLGAANHYFMPSLLSTLSDFTLPEERAADPLVISFPFEMVPSGLLPATIVELLSSQHWKLYETQKPSFEKLYKNHFELTFADYPGTITFRSNSKDIAVCPSSSFPAVKLPRVYIDVAHALDRVCERFSFNKLHKFGFRCPCGDSPPHAAVLSSDLAVTVCSRDPKHGGLLTPKQELWAPVSTEDMRTLQCAPEVHHESAQTVLELRDSVRTDTEMKEVASQTHFPIAAGALRGVDVLAEMDFTYTGAAQNFEWKDHGLKLHFPENALPPDVSACVVHIKAAISGQFQMPKGAELVSGIYCIYCSHKLTSNVTLDIQHCVEIPSSGDVADLSIVTAKCSQPNLPYSFQDLKGGVFSQHTSFASIQLSHFSMFGAVKRGRRQNYCSQLYYSERSPASNKVFFIITQDLELHITKIKEEFSTSGAVAGPHQEVVFAKDEIKLNIPLKGVEFADGGSIIPLTHPGIRRGQVDGFHPGRRIPSCELLIKRHSGPDVKVFRVKLVGAKEPNNFFSIECHPASAKLRGAGTVMSSDSQKPKELDVNVSISSVINWLQLGQHLEIEFVILEAILRDYAQYGTEFQRSKMVNTWLKSDPEASWSKLCGALERMGERALAYEIREKHP